MSLTDREVKTAKAEGGPKKLSDGEGMYLLVLQSGAKYWRLKYRYAGKEKVLALGVYPDVSLARAREKKAEARKLLVDGLDPSLRRKIEKRQQILRHINTFEAVAHEWHESRLASWGTAHAVKILHSLEKDIFPVIGKRPIAEITPAEMLEVLRVIEKRGALESTARVKQRCSAVFRYAIVTGRAEKNPVTELHGAFKTTKKTNYAALKASELPEFVRKLDAYDGQIMTKLALRLIVYTFVRTGELRGAEAREFNLEAAQWRIPAERMKMGEEHIVPLSKQAVKIVKELLEMRAARGGNSPLLFQNQASPEKPMSENTMLYALYRMGYHTRATVHGFRATASTTLNELGFNPDVIERQLAHRERNKVRAAYNRAEYLNERVKMMQHWANFIDEMANPKSNVTPIKSKAVA
jgi:integrase